MPSQHDPEPVGRIFVQRSTCATNRVPQGLRGASPKGLGVIITINSPTACGQLDTIQGQKTSR